MGPLTLRGHARRLVLGLSAAVILISCSGTTDDPLDPEPDQPPEGHARIVDWSDPLRVVEFEDGWAVHACEGDAPLLCAEQHGNHVGVVEALGYPMESFDFLDPGQDSDSNLMALASDFLESFSSDRASGCGSDYRFEPIEPEPVVLANTPGLVYGFVGTTSDGVPSELILQYATIVGDELVLIVAAAYDEGGCPGRDELSSFDTESLSVFRPHLESVLHESSLPDLDV